jgi:hypothetical protein
VSSVNFSDGGDKVAQAGKTANEGSARYGGGCSSIGAARTPVAKGEHSIATSEIKRMRCAYLRFIFFSQAN